MAPASQSLSIHVPFRIRKVGGRKQVVLPDGAMAAPDRPRPDSALIKALARAFRWKRMLESGEFTTIGDLAQREGIAPSYMTRVLRLTLLAPDIVEAIVDGRQGTEVTLAVLLEPFPAAWIDQTLTFCRHMPVHRFPATSIVLTSIGDRSLTKSFAESLVPAAVPLRAGRDRLREENSTPGMGSEKRHG